MLESKHAQARVPHVSKSRKDFLSSCNMTLAIKTCIALVLLTASDKGSTHRKLCMWGERSIKAGLGHQTKRAPIRRPSFVSLWPAKYFPAFSANTDRSPASYEWSTDFFGLEAIFRSLNHFVIYSPPDAGMSDQVSQSCKRFVRLVYGQCDDKLKVNLEANAKSSYFTSRVIHSLYAIFAPCLRQGSQCNGNWVEQVRTVPFDPAVVNIVWHIQIGDIVLYFTSIPLYRDVIGYMAPYLLDRKSVHL
jgi:hypothetical protein